MKKLIFLSNEWTMAIYDGDTGKLIHSWEHGNDVTFLFRDLAKHLGGELFTGQLVDLDGAACPENCPTIMFKKYKDE